MTEVVQYDQPATSGLVDHPKEWRHNGHFVLVAATDYWQTGCIKVAVPRSSLVNEFHNAELMCNLHHSSIFALVVKPLRNARSSRKVATWPPQTGHLCHLFIKVLLCWGHPFVSLHLGDKYPHIFCLQKYIYPHTSFPDLLSSIFQSFLSNSLNHLPK